jgi:hypothetical protein
MSNWQDFRKKNKGTGKSMKQLSIEYQNKKQRGGEPSLRDAGIAAAKAHYEMRQTRKHEGIYKEADEETYQLNTFNMGALRAAIANLKKEKLDEWDSKKSKICSYRAKTTIIERLIKQKGGAGYEAEDFMGTVLEIQALRQPKISRTGKTENLFPSDVRALYSKFGDMKTVKMLKGRDGPEDASKSEWKSILTAHDKVTKGWMKHDYYKAKPPGKYWLPKGVSDQDIMEPYLDMLEITGIARDVKVLSQTDKMYDSLFAIHKKDETIDSIADWISPKNSEFDSPFPKSDTELADKHPVCGLVMRDHWGPGRGRSGGGRGKSIMWNWVTKGTGELSAKNAERWVLDAHPLQ